MSPTPLEISIAIAMVAVFVTFYGWFRRSEAAASAARMADMMGRAGLASGIGANGEAGATAVMKEAGRRCARCPVEGHCERWLQGSVEGDNAFCANVPVFAALSRTASAA
ncbi:MAG: DUF6455 family protein [Rhodospirillales bacterium]|nr:DUF6455 family protein [Rhodospirillales bacterium]